MQEPAGTSEETRARPILVEMTGRRIAVSRDDGTAPAIVWLGGFRSDMTSTKAQALRSFAHAEGRACVLFDYSGHGASEGRFEDYAISDWLEDSLGVIERFAGPRPILVGSSMGGWIAVLAAMRLRQSLSGPSGLVLIAPALDFTERLMWAQFPPVLKAAIERDGIAHIPSQYSDQPTPITRKLIEDGRRHLLLGASFEIGCPVHILQGMRDPDVPYGHALDIVEHLPHDQVALTLINDGDHRLSRDEDIARLIRAVAAMEARSGE